MRRCWHAFNSQNADPIVNSIIASAVILDRSTISIKEGNYPFLFRRAPIH